MQIQILCVSEEFTGKNIVQRQKLVYKAIWEELNGKLNVLAVSLTLLTVSYWNNRSCACSRFHCSQNSKGSWYSIDYIIFCWLMINYICFVDLFIDELRFDCGIIILTSFWQYIGLSVDQESQNWTRLNNSFGLTIEILQWVFLCSPAMD